MNTEDLIKEAKARFHSNYQKNQLKEKYKAKLLFADQGGLWLAGPDLFAILQFFLKDDVVLTDVYDNPVKVNRNRLWVKATEVYTQTMDEWLQEYETLKNYR